MIFYTLKGPNHQLEIYNDKLKVIRNFWVSLFFKKPRVDIWEINQLSQFEITTPKVMVMSGKIQWQTFTGEVGTFRFSTTPDTVKKIELYLQKRVIKNHQSMYNLGRTQTMSGQFEKDAA